MTSAHALTPAQRRALLRRHHPDLGGDADEFVRVMAALEALHAPGAAARVAAPPPSPSREGTAPGPAPVAFASGPTRLTPGTGRARRRRVLRRLRALLPRRVPGARRYGRL